MRKRIKYEIRVGAKPEIRWIPVKAADEQDTGWLHYELRDGTNGLARPGTWRVKL